MVFASLVFNSTSSILERVLFVLKYLPALMNLSIFGAILLNSFQDGVHILDESVVCG